MKECWDFKTVYGVRYILCGTRFVVLSKNDSFKIPTMKNLFRASGSLSRNSGRVRGCSHSIYQPPAASEIIHKVSTRDLF